MHGDRISLGRGAGGDDYDGGGAAFRLDDGGGVREHHAVVHHVVRDLHGNPGDVGASPGGGGAGAGVLVEGDETRVPEAEEPGAHVGHHLQVPGGNSGAGSAPAGGRAHGTAAEGRGPHRLPLREDVSGEGHRGSGVPGGAVGDDLRVGGRRGGLPGTAALLRVRVPAVPGDGEPGVLGGQLEEEVRVHAAVRTGLHRGELPGMRDVPGQVAVHDQRDGGDDVRAGRVRHTGADVRGAGRAGAGV